MSQPKNSVTQAVRLLRAAGVECETHPYRYVPGGGTGQFARGMEMDEHWVIKTLIMEDEAKNPMIVLMQGDQEVSTKRLARELGAKHVRPCNPQTANRHSGYQVGGTSPFGTRRKMPVYCEASIVDLPRIYINGGKRGLIVSMRPLDMQRLLNPVLLSIAR